MSEPRPNIPLLRKAVEWAEAEAQKPADQRLWEQRDYVTEKACGTAYCIAGYAVAISPNTKVLDDDWPVIGGTQIPWHDAGRLLLGLSVFEGECLFDETNDIATVREIAERIAARAGERL